MTQREFFMAVVNGGSYTYENRSIQQITVNIFNEDGTFTDEAIEFAKSRIKALDIANNNRKNGSSKTAKAMEEWRTKVNAFLPTAPDTGMTAKQIAKALTTDEEEVSTQKVTAIMKTYENDTVETYEDKDEKKNKVKFYRFTA